MIKRHIIPIINDSYKRRKIIVILGPRQVGKSTLLDELSNGKKKMMAINCDNEDERSLITDKTSTELKMLISPYELFFIDEAQRVRDIGLTLKKIGDMKLDTQVIATGSSSLGLSDKVNESATGRLIEYNLYPLSLTELADHTSSLEERRLLETRMIYGTYPEVVTSPEAARQILMNLTNNYLYKDLFSLNGIKKPDVVTNLVKALALQIGSEVSYNELAGLVGVDKATVENYINLLEHCFIIFRINSFSRNLRNEIKKGKKIYFYDNGIRNAILSNFAPLELRNDSGMLWENIMMAERIKHNAYYGNYANLYFWRTHDQKEIDLIEERDGKLSTYEFKWNEKRKAKMPKTFSETYPNSTFEVISRENFWSFLRG